MIKAYLLSGGKEEFIEEITKKSVLNENEGQDYSDMVNKLFDNKIERLKQEIPELTPADLIVIAFICLKVNL